MSDIAKNNVISLDEYESSRRKSGDGAIIRALEDVRELCCQRITENIRYMMTKCDDTLYGCAQLAESSTVENLYLDAINELKAISSDLEKLFADRFVEQFNLGVPRYTQPLGVSQPGAEQDGPDIPYLKKERASEDLAVCKLIEKTRVGCAEILVSLDRRIGFLVGDPDLELWKNPVSPEPICEAFRTTVTEAIRQLKHGFEMRPVLFSLFDEYVLGDMDAIYNELNLHLIKLGVQPQLHTNAQTPDCNGGMPGHQELLFSDNPVPYPELGARCSREQVTIQADSGVVDKGAENGEQQLLNNLPLQQYGPEEPQLNQNAGRPDDITIDVVAMMFERILENKSIADSMRAVLGRLQIPFIKVAIQEQRFFSDKKHPARLLLDRLADSVTGWDENLGHEDPLYRKIDAIVQTILNGFDQDTSLFGTLLEDLDNFLGNREAQAEINVQRSIKVLEGEEQLEDARSRAMDQVEKHTRSGLNVDFINDFIATRWRDLLLLIYARQGNDSEEWTRALSTMDDLVWSVKPKNSKDEHQRLMSMQPQLLNSLREGMCRLSVPVTEQDDFFAKLAHAHACTFPGNKPAEQSVETEYKDAKTEKVNVVAEDEAGKSNTQNRSSRGCEVGIDDIFITQARQLQPGTWIEIQGNDGKTKRVKLSWVSPITRTCLLTDQMGLKVGNYSIEELARLLRAARAGSWLRKPVR